MTWQCHRHEHSEENEEVEEAQLDSETNGADEVLSSKLLPPQRIRLWL